MIVIIEHFINYSTSELTDMQLIVIKCLIHFVGLNVEDLFNRITVVSFENIVMKELERLRRIDLAHSVVERSTLIS